MAGEEHRLKRLLGGEHRLDDLSSLFLFVREAHKECSEAVREIGNFIAHRLERNKGFTTVKCKEALSVSHILFKYGGGTKLDLRQKIDPDFKVFVYANLRMLHGGGIRLHKSLTKAKTILDGGFGKARYDADGYMRFYDNLTARWLLSNEELDLIQRISLCQAVEGAFSGDEIVAGLKRSLICTGLLIEADYADFESISRTVQLYSVSVMHGARIRISDSQTVRLSLGMNRNEPGKVRLEGHYDEGPEVADGDVWINMVFSRFFAGRFIETVYPLIGTKFTMKSAFQEGVLLHKLDVNRAFELNNQGRLSYI